MAKKCIYCGTEVASSCVIDFCERCGVGVFGRKMFDTIIRNMEEARDNGDLCHMTNTCEIVEDPLGLKRC
ncbi:hypothetical protein GOV13_01060 [Candidatus Pacearchaeota archaeon]|nr:hypothetical protein [Candidatus Pacearchaeota archaeon]